MPLPESEDGVLGLLPSFRDGGRWHTEGVAITRHKTLRAVTIRKRFENCSVLASRKQPRRWELNFHRLAVYEVLSKDADTPLGAVRFINDSLGATGLGRRWDRRLFLARNEKSTDDYQKHKVRRSVHRLLPRCEVLETLFDVGVPCEVERDERARAGE